MKEEEEAQEEDGDFRKPKNDGNLKPKRKEALYIEDHNGYDSSLEQCEMPLIVLLVQIPTQNMKPLEEKSM